MDVTKNKHNLKTELLITELEEELLSFQGELSINRTRLNKYVPESDRLRRLTWLVDSLKELFLRQIGGENIKKVQNLLQRERKITQCIPAQDIDEYPVSNTIEENLCYTLFDILQGKHNDLLREIIERTEKE